MEGYGRRLEPSGGGKPVLYDDLLSLSGDISTKMCRSTPVADQEAVLRTGSLAH
jgi:hypothetical protein